MAQQIPVVSRQSAQANPVGVGRGPSAGVCPDTRPGGWPQGRPWGRPPAGPCLAAGRRLPDCNRACTARRALQCAGVPSPTWGRRDRATGGAMPGNGMAYRATCLLLYGGDAVSSSSAGSGDSRKRRVNPADGRVVTGEDGWPARAGLQGERDATSIRSLPGSSRPWTPQCCAVAAIGFPKRKELCRVQVHADDGFASGIAG